MPIEGEGLDESEFAVLQRCTAMLMGLCSPAQMLAITDQILSTIKAQQQPGLGATSTEGSGEGEIMWV